MCTVICSVIQLRAVWAVLYGFSSYFIFFHILYNSVQFGTGPCNVVQVFEVLSSSVQCCYFLFVIFYFFLYSSTQYFAGCVLLYEFFVCCTGLCGFVYFFAVLYWLCSSLKWCKWLWSVVEVCSVLQSIYIFLLLSFFSFVPPWNASVKLCEMLYRSVQGPRYVQCCTVLWSVVKFYVVL